MPVRDTTRAPCRCTFYEQYLDTLRSFVGQTTRAERSTALIPPTSAILIFIRIYTVHDSVELNRRSRTDSYTTRERICSGAILGNDERPCTWTKNDIHRMFRGGKMYKRGCTVLFEVLASAQRNSGMLSTSNRHCKCVRVCYLS